MKCEGLGVTFGNSQQENAGKTGDLNPQVADFFGFRFEYGSAHTARTMMFKDLQLLL